MFEVHFSDGCRQMKTFETLQSATMFINELKSDLAIRYAQLFKADSNFHSTTQLSHLISWFGVGSYWDNLKNRLILEKNQLEAKQIEIKRIH